MHRITELTHNHTQSSSVGYAVSSLMFSYKEYFLNKKFSKNSKIILDIENELNLKVRLCHFLSTLPRIQ